jgi:acyl carrier protein
MAETNIEKGVKEILAKRLNIDENRILKTSNLKDDLGMDSFGAIEVMFEIEDRFGISVEEKDLLDVKIIQDMIDYIAKKVNRGSSKTT